MYETRIKFVSECLGGGGMVIEKGGMGRGVGDWKKNRDLQICENGI